MNYCNSCDNNDWCENASNYCDDELCDSYEGPEGEFIGGTFYTPDDLDRSDRYAEAKGEINY